MEAATGVTQPSYLELVANLVAAGILGGIIGVQRQIARKPAGFRTHLLVALGCCAFMEVSRLSGDSRIAAGVITGIGFLGAGAIVREGLTTRGLTTAASIWAVAAIGLALGFGTPAAYALGGLTTVLAFGALAFSDSYLENVFPPKAEVDAWITFEMETIAPERVVALFESACSQIDRSERFDIVWEGERRVATWLLVLHTKDRAKLRQLGFDAAGAPGVRRVAFSELEPG